MGLKIFQQRGSKGKNGTLYQYKTPLVFNSVRSRPQKTSLPKINYKFISYFLFLLIIIYIVLFSPVFSIKDIIVEGNGNTPTEAITSSMPTGKNIFKVDQKSIKEGLLVTCPEIKDVQIYKGIPNALKVVVLEHDNKIIWQTNGRQYLVSSQGVVSKEIQLNEKQGMPIVVDLKSLPVKSRDSIVPPEFIAFIQNIESNLFQITNLKPIRYEVAETTFDVDVITEQGLKIRMNTIRPWSIQVENLKNLLVSKRTEIKEYVDLRIDGWAYYK